MKPSSVTHARDARRAITVSTLCIASYLVSYILRNLLAVFNPQMIGSGAFTEGMTAALSSVYMISYATGQLVMGMAGDYLHPRLMITTGLLTAGGAMLAFSAVPVGLLSYVFYALLGLALAMLRGPIVRLITGSCTLAHARLANLFLSFAGFVGPLIAGLFVLRFTYRETYAAVGCLSVLMALAFFFLETLLERRGYVCLPVNTQQGGQNASFRTLFREDKLGAYLLLAMAVEITTASVNHWLTLYMTEALSMTESASATTYSLLLLLRALATFVSLPLFYTLGRRVHRVLVLSFGVAGVLFLVMFLSPVHALSLGCLVVAEIATSIASAAVWSIYLPSLSSRGRVSGVNGLMDAAGYFVAALANLVFVPIKAAASFGGLLLSWCAVCAISVGIAALAGRRACEGGAKDAPQSPSEPTEETK